MNRFYGIVILLSCFFIFEPTVFAQLAYDYPIQPVDFTKVKVEDKFWAPKIKVNEEVTIPYTFQKCEAEGRMDNFYRAAGILKIDKRTTFTFDDSDLYKVIEGASYSLQSKNNMTLSIYLDTLIDLIASAQEDDGYLFTFSTIHKTLPHEWLGTKRWEKEEDLSHELYNAGHLFEAAAAHYRATGKNNLLNIAIKNADLLVKTFGWGKEERFPGHQIIETGLVKLYRITGKKDYLDLAKFFLDLRGKEGHFNQEYSQSHIQVVDQKTAVGHAVRATYMYSGMADIAALTGNIPYQSAIDNIWQNVVNKKMYITGGIGSTRNGEAFGDEYELPNMSAYAETCAAIANVYWNMRMFALHGEGKYIDVLERTLYNGLISGVSLSGDHFFYPNPLASIGQHQRSSWHNCACCITNMTRFLPSMPGYIYAQNGNNLYLNLFVGSTSTIDLPATKVELIQKTDYPWSGVVDVAVNPHKLTNFALHIRIPGWAVNQPVPGDLYTYSDQTSKKMVILLNGKPTKYRMEKGFAIIQRNWKKGDHLSLNFDMAVKKVISNEKVKANKNRFAMEMGPIVYCLEGPDNVENMVMNILVDKNVTVSQEFKPELLNGIMVLKMQGKSYKEVENNTELAETSQEVTAIPYFAWANRGPSEMQVWVPYEPSAVRAKVLPSIASKCGVSSSAVNKKMERSVNDQYYPTGEGDDGATYLHWWPNKNTTEWIQYDFDDMYTVSESSVFWFDDGPWGGCRIPLSWQIFYKKDDEWVPVNNSGTYPIQKSSFNSISFLPVTTSALKLVVQLPEDNSAGLYEWIIK